MRVSMLRLLISVFVVLLTVTASAIAGPYEHGVFRGRIAYSADGNYNDPDDWASSPMVLAILERAGLRERLVHFDYNCILPRTDKQWEKKNADSVLGAAERFGYAPRLFHDCQTDLQAAVDSIARAINESTAENPLYFILAGPMEVPALGIEKSDPQRRQHVYCISHSRWNDGFSSQARHDFFTCSKRRVIELGINWVQIHEQSGLSTSPYGREAKPEEWQPFHWLRDSRDEKLKFLWERLVVSTRPDCSDSGMAYFLATGDEAADPAKLKRLLADKLPSRPLASRERIRLEAENFAALDGFELDYRNDRKASHRMSARLTGTEQGAIRTALFAPYLPQQAVYRVEVRALAESGHTADVQLVVNGRPQGEIWTIPSASSGWISRTFEGVELRAGDQIAVTAKGQETRVDYVDLINTDDSPAARLSRRIGFEATGPLDDPHALPGQILVAGSNPGYLKRNGGPPIYLCGPDNPEEFLYWDTMETQPDGKKKVVDQAGMIAKLVASGCNALHCQVFRMQRCNFKNEGRDDHCPFLNHDPTQPLDSKLLDHWDEMFAELERHGIVVHLEFYNDATDVERMGWTLDAQGKLHPDEERMFVGVVERFKNRRNIMWGLEESCNKLPIERVLHFKKLGELIARTDDHHHPIVQSFVVPNDPEGDFSNERFASDDYADDPNIRVVTWLHVIPHDDDYNAQHAEYLKYMKVDAKRFVTMKNETYHFPRQPIPSRRYMWSAAMTGLQNLEAYHPIWKTDLDMLSDDGRIRVFMEQTDFYRMESRDDLAAGDAKWALARPGESYIVYADRGSSEVGVKNLPAGQYDLLWFDTTTGTQCRQTLTATDQGTWPRPAEVGCEVALYLRRAR